MIDRLVHVRPGPGREKGGINQTGVKIHSEAQREDEEETARGQIT